MGTNLVQQPQSLRLKPLGEKIDSGGVAAGPVEAAHQAERHRITTHPEDDRNGRGRPFRGERRVVADRNQHGHMLTHQIVRERWKTIELTLGRAELHRDVLTVDIAGLF
jgi:hypothetical protein